MVKTGGAGVSQFTASSHSGNKLVRNPAQIVIERPPEEKYHVCGRTVGSPEVMTYRVLSSQCAVIRPQSAGSANRASAWQVFRLLQLCILGLDLSWDGNVGVGVYPEGEEVLDGRFGLPYRGSPTLCTSSANRGSERRGSSKKSAFRYVR